MASDHIPILLYSLCTQSDIVIRVLQASDDVCTHFCQDFADLESRLIPGHVQSIVPREECQNKEDPIRVLFHLLREGCYRVALTCSVLPRRPQGLRSRSYYRIPIERDRSSSKRRFSR